MVKLFKPPKKNTKGHKPYKKVLTVDTLDHKGQGVSRGKDVTFIAGALPGERCEVLITEMKKGVATGALKHVIEAHPQRCQPQCEHYSQCGGCHLQHVADTKAIALKQQAIHDQLTRKLQLPDLPWQTPIVGEAWGYRRKARLAVDTRHGDCHIGFRDEKNRVFTINQCPIMSPKLEALIKPLQHWIPLLRAKRAVGHISLLDVEPQVTVVLRLTKPLQLNDKLSCQQFEREHSCRILVEDNDGKFEPVSFSSSMCQYTLLGFDYQFSADDFIQVNGAINQRMVAQAIDWLQLTANDKVLDLYCGIGNFSLPVAQKGCSVKGIEGVAEMVAKATFNAEQNACHLATKDISFVQDNLNVEGSLARLLNDTTQTFNKVLLDPARAGAYEIMPQLNAHPMDAVVYVSCNPATFLRDIAVLLSGHYQLSKIALVNMFPQTGHTEIMALLVPQIPRR